MANHELHEERILTQLEAGQVLSQRALSRDLGIALGLTNLLIARLVKKGWVRIHGVQRHRVRYLITPAGIAAKARLTREYVRHSIRHYREMRDRIRTQLSLASATVPGDGAIPTVFFGAGEVAEIAFVCIHETRLQLIALIDEERTKPFFDAPVYRASALSGDTVAGREFARLIVMPVDDEDQLKMFFDERGVAPDRIFWV